MTAGGNGRGSARARILHGGTVTAGELGDLRQQIVFVGDILNTAARLEEYA
jgi:class 3 adenylate cyclase